MFADELFFVYEGMLEEWFSHNFIFEQMTITCLAFPYFWPFNQWHKLRLKKYNLASNRSIIAHYLTYGGYLIYLAQCGAYGWLGASAGNVTPN